MKPLRCVHLNTDFALGGVTKALSLFDHPDLRSIVQSRVVPIDLKRMTAPKFLEDVIINHATPNWAALPFLFMLRLRHNDAWLVHVEHSYTRSWEALHVSDKGRFRTMLKLAYANFDEIVAVSRSQADWLVEAGVVPRGKVRVIHPWSGSTGMEDLPAPSFAADRPIRLGAMGRFDWIKGFDTLVLAMGLVAPGKFELALGGYGPERTNLVHLAGNNPHIRFAGKVEDAAAFYARCDAVVLPSRCESFGLVAAEARQAGRPILVADVDGLPEQTAGGAGMIADCSSPRSMAYAIEQLAQADLHEMGRQARLSMAGAETSRINSWVALFVRVQQVLGKRGKLAAGLGATA